VEEEAEGDDRMKAVVLDTETTGLIVNRTVRRSVWPEVIEFSSVTFDWETFEELGEYSVLIKPSGSIGEETTKRTRITNEMVANAPAFRGVGDKIKALVETSDVVLAHNASFDVEMLDMEYERINRKVTWPRTICTVEQTAAINGHRMSLSALHEHLFGVKFEDAHRAEADVRALLRCVIRLREDGYL
jgi:DNA polymerase III epsilon subunit-like protein